MDNQPIEDILVHPPDVAAMLVLFKITIASSQAVVIAAWQGRNDKYRHLPCHLPAIISL